MKKPTKRIEIGDISFEYMKEYGSYVIEERALPDYRDGLKPVQRRILWAAHRMGLSVKSKRVKSARLEGQVMGVYHPHGSSYPAIVNIATCPVPLIDGEGNWGSYSSGAASSRYTECRLTQFSDSVLLDSESLAVAPMIPNYDGVDQEPLYLPAMLPTVLLNGVAGIATGTTVRIPPFTLKSVLPLVKKAFQDKVTPKDCISLVPNFLYGGKCLSSKQELLDYYKTGSGTLSFSCEYSVDANNRVVTITSLDPFFNYESFASKVMEIDPVSKFENHTSAKDKYVLFKVVFKKVDSATFNAGVAELVKLMKSSVICRTNITIRKRRETEVGYESYATFKQTTIPEIFNSWARWRVKYQEKRLKYRLNELKRALAYQELMAYAAQNVQIIMQVLKQAKDLDETLAKKLKITVEEAKTILDRSTRSLSNLSLVKAQAKIKELKTQVSNTKTLLKNPVQSVLDDLTKLEESL